MRFWLEFFMDKRFSLDFKIANFIMRDYLRNYLVVDCTVLKEVAKSSDLSDYNKKVINYIANDLNRIMKA